MLYHNLVRRGTVNLGTFIQLYFPLVKRKTQYLRLFHIWSPTTGFPVDENRNLCFSHKSCHVANAAENLRRKVS